MELSRQSPVPARFTGIGIVIAVHVVAIAALSLAFVKPTPKPPGPIEFRRVPEAPPPPQEPPPVVRATRPDLPQVPVPDVPIPDWRVDTAPPITTAPLRNDGVAPPTGGPTVGTSTPTVAVTQDPPVVRTAGAVCSVMPRPELPMLNWSGEAVLHALATVRDGRVIASEIRVAQGAMDAKSRRALQRSVEAALAGYQCAGNATFQQDFAFSID